MGILGVARSGLAAAQLVKSNGGVPFLSDISSNNRVKEKIAEIEQLNVDYELGRHSIDILSQQDLIVLSPGIPIDKPIVTEIVRTGVEVISELELAARLLPCPMIAVTGTNGKTTTAALIGHILDHTGTHNVVAGNIGHPLSAAIPSLTPESWVVVEVSTFQLEAAPTFRPKVSAILNITPDHLDRHGTFENYVQLKQRIFQNQQNDDVLVYNVQDSVVVVAVASAKCRKNSFALRSSTATVTVMDNQIIIRKDGSILPILGVGDIVIPGAHNIENALAAVACTDAIGIDHKAICEGIRSFQGVEHRLETIGVFGGVTWINDSKATNVQAGIIALNAMTVPTILLAGGRAKSEDYSRVRPVLSERIKAVVVFGEAASLLEEAWRSCAAIHRVANLQDAVELAAGIALPGDTVLLSPMGSSFDQFVDFEERGQRFKQWVGELY